MYEKNNVHKYTGKRILAMDNELIKDIFKKVRTYAVSQYGDSDVALIKKCLILLSGNAYGDSYITTDGDNAGCKSITYIELQDYLSSVNEKKHNRKEKGVFYTPHDVVKFILDSAISVSYGGRIGVYKRADKRVCACGIMGQGCIGKTVFDPTCGAGEFLVSAVAMKLNQMDCCRMECSRVDHCQMKDSGAENDVARRNESGYSTNINGNCKREEKKRDTLIAEKSFHNGSSPTDRIVTDNSGDDKPHADYILRIVETIYGNDIDETSVFITKLRLLLCIIDRYGMRECLRVCEILNRNITCYDFISSEYPDSRRFDIIVGNPPYVEDSKYNGVLYKRYGNIYANVLKSSADFLCGGGVMGFVIPVSYMSTPRMKKIRDELEEDLSEQHITSYADRPDCLFRAAHQKLCILVGKKNCKTREEKNGKMESGLESDAECGSNGIEEDRTDGMMDSDREAKTSDDGVHYSNDKKQKCDRDRETESVGMGESHNHGSSTRCTVYTGNYQYWYSEERAGLFDNINMERNNFTGNGYIPKLGTQTDIAVFRKVWGRYEKNLSGMAVSINACKTTGGLSGGLCEEQIGDTEINTDCAFLNMGGSFWIKAFRRPHMGSGYKCFRFDNAGLADYFMCLLNSSLFWWFWVCVSDGWHITNKELSEFTVPLPDGYRELSALAEHLESALERTKQYVGTKQTEYEYKHKLCLDEIHAVDDYINSLYGLTDGESKYIKNFALKYRTGGMYNGNN